MVSLLMLSLVATITILVSSLYLIWKRRGEQGQLPPGPRGLPLLGNLPFLSPDLHRCFAELSQIYGPIMSLQLGTKRCVVVSSPSAARQVLKDHDAIFANRDVPAVALISSYGCTDMAWSPYGPHWRMIRKVSVRELLSPANIEAVYSLRRREVRRTIRELHSKAGQPVEIREVMFLTGLNVIASMLWGSTVVGGGGGGGGSSSVGREFREVMDGILELLGMANVSDFFPLLAPLDLQGLGRRMKALCAWIDRFLNSIIEQRLRMDEAGGGSGGATKSRDFLQMMLELVEKGDPQSPLTTDHVKALFLDLVAGGTDTTSKTVEWALVQLLRNPEKMVRAQEELDAVVGKDGIVEEFHIPRLHYLDAVMKEVLRLHPVTPLLIPHCPSSSCTLGQYLVPKGTKVFVNVWAIQRDPSVWEDPLEFKPERFLDATSNEGDYRGNNFNYLPFGSGRRICVGITMAERMVMYQLASLLHSFEWQLTKGTNLDLSETFGIVLKKAEPLVAVPTLRLSNPELYE